MIQNYKARIDALYHIQIAIDDLSGIVIKDEIINLSICYLKSARKKIISEMNER